MKETGSKETTSKETGRMTIMAHMIPFFPDLPRSRRVAQGLLDGGARYIEVQFPYSDPTADGPDIQGAGARALSEGFTTRAGWDFVASLREAATAPTAMPGAPAAHAPTPTSIFVMSYAGLVFAHGVEQFVARAAELGVEGVIVPDLPLDSDEGLLDAGARHGVNVVPVIALGAAPHRVELVHSARTRYIYASLRRGITGTHTDIGAENIAFMRELGSRGARVLAGFGIATSEQVAAVTEHAHAAVVGSAFVRAVRSAADPYAAVRALTEELTTAPAAHDTATHDTAAHDTAAHDTAAHDTAAHDTAAHDTATHDTAAHDTAAHDTAAHDTAAHDTAAHDTAAQDN